MDIEIKKFNLDNISRTNNVAIIGRRGTGKTTLVKKILEKLNKDNKEISGIVFDNYNSYKSIERVTEFKIYDSNVLKSLIDEQCKCLNKKPVFVVMDNICLTKEIMGDHYFNDLFINSRHYNIFVIIAISPNILLPPNIRANIDYIFLAKEDSISMRKKLYKYSGYENRLLSYNNFINILTSITTEKYRFMFIDNNDFSDNGIYYY